MIQTNSDEARSKLIQIFRYIQALNQLRHPPQKEIIPWLKGGWQNVDAKVDINQTIRTGASNQIQHLNFDDDPQRKRRLEEWKEQRERWVDNERPSRRTMDLFEKLYALQSQLERESELFELLLGDGLLHWKIESIHHPVLLLHLRLRFNPEIAEFTLFETGQSTELYTALLTYKSDRHN